MPAEHVVYATEEVLAQKAHRACWQPADTFTAHRDHAYADRIMTLRDELGYEA